MLHICVGFYYYFLNAFECFPPHPLTVFSWGQMRWDFWLWVFRCDNIIINLEMTEGHLLQIHSSLQILILQDFLAHCKENSISFRVKCQSNCHTSAAGFPSILFHLFLFIEYKNLFISGVQRRPLDGLRWFKLSCFIHKHFFVFIHTASDINRL